jgi:hypothetical protein
MVTIERHLRNQRHDIPHLRVSTKFGRAFLNCQSSVAAMLMSTTASVTSQILEKRKGMKV